MKKETQTIEERLAKLREYEIKDFLFDNPYAIWESKDPAVNTLRKVLDELQIAYNVGLPTIPLRRTYARAENGVDTLCASLTKGEIDEREYTSIVDGTHPLIRDLVETVKESDAVIKRYNSQSKIRKCLTYSLCLNELDRVRMEAKARKANS